MQETTHTPPTVPPVHEPRSTRQLSPADRELELVTATEAGDTVACTELVAAFLPRITAMARRYQSVGIGRDELIQDGVVGLLRATRRYDATIGTPFWGYASWWVRKAMQEHVAELARPVALSDHAVRALSQLRAARAELRSDSGVEPTPSELASALGLPRSQVESLLAIERRPRHLEEPLDSAEEMTVGEALVDPGAEDAYRAVVDQAEIVEVRTLVDTLSARERTVLWSHYGFDQPARTLGEIGADLGVTAERARQIEAAALERLRAAVVDPVAGLSAGWRTGVAAAVGEA